MCSRALAEHGVAIDNFYVNPVPAGTQFFLTHLHKDHMDGLTPNWSGGILNVSETTYKLMQRRYKGKTVLGTVKPWVIGKWRTVQLLGGATKVCCVDAHHSTGSVMWCFKFPNGSSVVHTGDYRPTADTFNWDGWEKLRPVSILLFDSSMHDPRVNIPSLENSSASLEHVFNLLGPGQRLALLVHTSGVEELVGDWCRRYGHTWALDENCKNYEETLLGFKSCAQRYMSGSSQADVYCVGSKFRDQHEGSDTWVFVKPSLVWYMCHKNELVEHEFDALHLPIPDETHTFRVFYSNHASFQENQALMRFLHPTMTLPCVDAVITERSCQGTSARPEWAYASELKEGAPRARSFRSKRHD